MSGAVEERTYDAWNHAVIEQLFNSDLADRPAYLDMGDATVSGLAQAFEIAEDQVLDELVAVTVSRLQLAGGYSSVFFRYVDDIRAWRKQESTEQGPPVVGLLAVLTLAARAMGEDADFAPHAYYPRLYRLLGVTDPDIQFKVQQDYRDCAEYLWRSLNDWLTQNDGRLGLPTAYALTHRYVGLPMSQALVRSADRLRFPRMFRDLGLHAGADLPPESLVPLIDVWVNHHPSPASRHFQSIWAAPATRERVAAVVAIELLHWNGEFSDQDHDDSITAATAGSVLLQALLMRFPRPGLELSFIADFGRATPTSVTILSAEDPAELDLVPIAGGRVRPRSASALDTASLVEGMLQVHDSVSQRDAVRRPRRVVPLRRDELVNVHIESERVQLGEDLLLLVKDDPALRRRLQTLLDQIARPGFEIRDSYPGVPAGWLLVTDVQIMSRPPSDPGSDLNVLIPLVAAQITFAGGLRLPGRGRKWSSLRPPEIRAIVSDAETIEVSLTSVETELPDGFKRSWTSQEPALLVDLSTSELSDGDYEITLSSQERILQQTVLRLRSADSPDAVAWDNAPFLVHHAEEPISVLTARAPDEDSDIVIEGPYAPLDADGEVVPRAAEKDVWWNAPRPLDAESTPVTITRPDPTSCVSTGAHRIELPDYLGRPRGAFVTGVCSTCGVVKRYPAWFSRRREHEFRRRSDRAAGPSFDVRNLPDVRASAAGWNEAFDALIHGGGGTYSDLERIALQLEGSSLFLDTFTRALESLGHLEIHRDATLQPVQWCLSPPYLAQLVSGSFLVSGKWQPHVLLELEASAAAAGGTMRSEAQESGPDRLVIDGISEATANELVGDWGVGVVSERGPAGPAMLRTLPPLSKVATALPRIPTPGARRIRRFDPASASWVGTPFADSPGAYRLDSSFASIDVFRDEHDVAANECALGTVHLIKHLDALRIGRPMVAYSPDTQQLAVPLGADLPGLYGRAAVLCSGRLPTRITSSRCLVYTQVPQEFAEHLVGLLSA